MAVRALDHIQSFYFVSVMDGWINLHSCGPWNSEEQPREEAPQLIEIVRVRNMYVFTDRDFVTLSNLLHSNLWPLPLFGA